ncbi:MULTISPECIES: hypothetical protein [Amycolatopsis]|uniref:Uncharacterized protein n=1 Tax=Amycolatopsis dendrobii TaxID=2760662 RepID=A0A7W3VR86_9PSEU|nr:MULTISPECIES: hypothetical protein [Amycolatopsis]MBB1151580.1 hypothetical protein [Amycolatopsis dendrobii]UKD58209.1 hypothetical protein L3Q65_16200 [Amycolatopsis sp. FU40]
MSRRSVQVLAAFGVLAVGVFLKWLPLFAAEPGRACLPGKEQPAWCGPSYANPAEWGAVLVGGAILALLYLRYLADREQVR